ncbi:hypothetical protein LJY25_08215 [Hymenobacter sp. BT175]|uniref:hypothetical protein n=1 Tax=Hymenobacter translucens TaxID=2886507 RepID=UPI001D0EAE43|nr:hypothetical protein [Hymenobacter translucens]MCC2546426.1 hypothetical protein [Hymenobacter translucens]
MDFKFKSLATALGLTTADATITEANLKQANNKIEELEREKTGAEQKAATALADLATMTTRATTAEGSLKTTQAELKTATDKVATLESWKKDNQAEDEREDDELNDDDEPKPAQKGASFETIASKHISRIKGVHGSDKK